MPQSDTFPSVAVVYLARGLGAGVDAARQFFVSYDQHPSGISHELIVLVKGWENVDGLDEVLSMARSHNARVIELPDDGFDLGAYFRAAKKIPHEWCCFLNSFSCILHDNWLKLLHDVATRPGVGAVSCGGNWGTVTNFWDDQVFAALKYAKLKTLFHLLKRACYIAFHFWPHIPAFPNPHIRTNAFMTQRKLWLDFQAASFPAIPVDKRDCYVLEHGRKSFTRFIVSKGLSAFILGADGKIFTPNQSLESGTFAVPGLPNLLIGDNQTEAYLSSPEARRREVEYWIWGKRLTPATCKPEKRLSALKEWFQLPIRILRKAGLFSLRKLCPPIDNKYKAYDELTERYRALHEDFSKRYKSLQDELSHRNMEISLLPGKIYTLTEEPLRFTSYSSCSEPFRKTRYLPPPELFLPFFNPIQATVSDDGEFGRATVNIILPSTSWQHTSGGPNTAYTLAAELVKRNIPIRFVSVTAPADTDNSAIRMHIAKIGGLTPEQAQIIEFLDAASDRNTPVQLGHNDIFIATAWWTAQMVKYILPLFNTQKIIYLIQDFEPLLHNASANYALALETYSMDMLPIFNSSLLRDYFIHEKVGRFADRTFATASLYFEPAVDPSIFYPPQPLKKTKKKRLLFYARPESQRNLLEIGIGALMKILAEGRCNPDEWEFFSSDTGVAGKCRPVVLSASPESILKPLAMRDLATWADELRNVDIMLSLILSPHTSYPPLEAAACGTLVVTNTWSVKTAERLSTISPNIIAGTPCVEGVADALVKAMALSDSERPAGASALSIPSSWPESWAPVMPRLMDFLAEHGVKHGR